MSTHNVCFGGEISKIAEFDWFKYVPHLKPCFSEQDHDCNLQFSKCIMDFSDFTIVTVLIKALTAASECRLGKWS